MDRDMSRDVAYVCVIFNYTLMRLGLNHMNWTLMRSSETAYRIVKMAWKHDEYR